MLQDRLGPRRGDARELVAQLASIPSRVGRFRTRPTRSTGAFSPTGARTVLRFDHDHREINVVATGTGREESRNVRRSPLPALPLLALASLAWGCATTSATLAGTQVQEAAPENMTSCAFLGTVVGGPTSWEIPSVEIAKTSALNQAAELSATHLVWVSVSGGRGPVIAMARAYRCTVESPAPARAVGESLFYDRDAGEADVYSRNAFGGLRLLHRYDDWGTRWDMAVTGSFAPGGLLRYDRSSGVAEFDSVNAAGGIRVLRRYGNWRTSWDLAVTGGFAPGGLLLYDRSAGVAAFYSVDSQGGASLLRQHDGWQKTWDLVATGSFAKGGLFLYDRGAGVGAFYAVDSQGGMRLLRRYDDWQKTWDLAALAGNVLFLYDRGAGVGAFYSADDAGSVRLLRRYDHWQKTWDLATLSGNTLLLYDRDAGVGAFYAVDSQGGMMLLRRADGWRTSWDLIANPV